MRKGGFFSIFFLILLVVALGGAGYLFFKDLDGPSIEIQPATNRVSPNTILTIKVEDSSGIRNIIVGIRRNNVLDVIYKKHFDESVPAREVQVPLKDAQLREGAFELEIRATDSSMAGFGQGNTRTRLLAMRLDTQPPRITMKTLPPNVRRGGAGVIRYVIDEEVTKSGVLVSGYFVPGFLQKDGSYICFFPFPYTMTAKNYKNSVEITATDLAGNVAKNRLNLVAIERSFRNDKIEVRDTFLETVENKLGQLATGAKNPLEVYLYINNEVRAANVEMIKNLSRDTSSAILWNGPFARLPGSAARAGFADHRYLFYQGKQVGEAYHLGFDLASVRNAPIPAGNSGRVIFTGDTGIYGNLVLIDHGLGVMSLYSHLSEVGVKAGEVVTRGQQLGKTGETGLAFGDHLHFGIVVGGLEVTPLEWFDAKWIKDNIVDRIGAEFFPQ